MKAMRYHEPGGPEVLRYEEVPDPEPGPVDVVVDVVAAALNRLDVVQRNGWFTMPGFTLPHIAGMDVAGVVSEVGADVHGVAVGDRVVVDPSLAGVDDRSKLGGRGDLYGELGIIGATVDGGYAERCLVPASHVYPVPHAMSLETAATFPTCWLTAAHALFDVGRLAAGETLMIHAAGSGGVGGRHPAGRECRGHRVGHRRHRREVPAGPRSGRRPCAQQPHRRRGRVGPRAD